MYFKKLEIFGFKSFADKTIMNFGPGITAVVGPNGCGKSNVFDAIRWVLGEQSVKEMRGSSMEDVIFNGTDKKPALGFAEVSLTFDNDSKMLPIEYNEVTITRRLFRSGESEYLINKTQVRLRDIVELFLGTGVGAEAYSLIQQGKVDLVVSAKPEERRMIFDEASGITKYKARRREALNKLKDTDNNLLRINDIVVEVKRQISSLERQANKARRYKTEFEKLKGLEVKFANSRLQKNAQDRAQLEDIIAELQEKESRLIAEVQEYNDLLVHENEMIEELEDKVNDIRAEDIRIDGQIDIKNRQIGFNEERIENIASNQRKMSENKEQIIERCKIQRQKIDEVRQALETLNASFQHNLTSLNEKRDLLQVITRDIQSAEAGIREEEERIIDITSKQVKIKNKLTESMKEIQGCIARKRRLEIESNKVENERVEVGQKFNLISGKYDQAFGRVTGLRRELETKNSELEVMTTQLSEIESGLDELEKKKLFFKSQKEFIEKLSVQYEDMPDPVIEGRLFTNAAPLSYHSGIIGKVKRVLPVDPARAAGIHPMAQNESVQIHEIICETKFIELDLQQISDRIEELSRMIGEKIVLKEDVIARVREQREVIGRVESAIQEDEKTLSILEAQKNDIQGESNKLLEEKELLEIELKEVEEQAETIKKEEEGLAFELETADQDLRASQVRIKEQEGRISQKIQEREEVTVAIAQMETEVSSVEDKRNGLNDNMAMFSETMDNYLEEIKRIDNESAEMDTKKEQFSNEIEELNGLITEMKEQKQSLGGVLMNYEKQKDEVAQRINSIRSNIVAYNQEIDEIKSVNHNKQMQQQEIVFKEKEIVDRLQQAYRINLDEYNLQKSQEKGSAEGEAATEESLDAEGMEVAIERLRKRCDSFGSVNLVAIEEFDELRERFEFLTKQQSDLITAKESLQQTIRNINRQTRQMFMNTFTKVSEEFRIYFRMLFGGGEAQLVLLDPDNVLESGIDIIARPPGKKLQNISLLSGGEKTLTAIALVFGVFKVNPSPFCVLDEIDAALDESNVGRYAYLLKDFAKIAQFIVITHNKKTIANAKVMYGITMQETGVSKVVSVKFNEKEANQESQQKVEVGV